jgi:chromate reductase, NAD(P)H dehydrogenase (quinone)
VGCHRGVRCIPTTGWSVALAAALTQAERRTPHRPRHAYGARRVRIRGGCSVSSFGRCSADRIGFGGRGVARAMPSQQQTRIRLLTVCGSLQARSANRAALVVASSVAAARGATVEDFERLAGIPAFDADRGDERIDVVEDWRRRIESADVVLVAAPEYAGGLAGAVKNAFDWLVASGSIYHKPVGVISAGTTGGQHARHTMAQTLTWQGAYVVAELGITAPRTKSDDDGRLTDAPTVAAISSLTEVVLAAAVMPATETVALARRVVGALDIDTAHHPVG